MTPTYEIIFLCFIINSMIMMVTHSAEKCVELKSQCTKVFNKHNVKIQDVAAITGKIVAIFPGAQYGRLHYRELEKDKTTALKLNRGSYDALMVLSKGALRDLEWSIHNVPMPTH